MPAADTVLLPLCVGLTLLGVIFTGLAWRRGTKGRVIQGIALALAPVALYFSGLLRLVWNGVVAVGTWISRVVFSPAVWFGLSLLAVCLLLWVVGGLLARRFPGARTQQKRDKKAARSGAKPQPAVSDSRTPAVRTSASAPAGRGAAPAPVDDDLAEIEALLKSRGIN